VDFKVDTDPLERRGYSSRIRRWSDGGGWNFRNSLR